MTDVSENAGKSRRIAPSALGALVRVDDAARQPLYTQLHEGIARNIRSGRLKSGDRLPNERVVAKALGVSIAPVRQAFAQLEEQGLLYRRPGRGTIIGRVNADDVPRPRTHTVGVVFSDLSTANSEGVIKGIHDQLEPCGYHMFVCGCGDDLHREMNHVDSLVEKGAEGLIIFPVGRQKGARLQIDHYRRLQRRSVPFVFIDNDCEPLLADAVVFDNYGAAYEAVRYLVQLGHRRIAHITVDTEAASISDRCRAYEQVLRDNGIDMDPSLIINGLIHENDMRPVMDDLLNRNVTAVFCVKERFALGVYRAALARGVQIPLHLSIIGFSVPRDIEQLGPKLTRLSPPSQRMGRVAAELLLERLKSDGKTNKPRKVVLDVPLQLGQSTAPPEGAALS